MLSDEFCGGEDWSPPLIYRGMFSGGVCLSYTETYGPRTNIPLVVAAESLLRDILLAVNGEASRPQVGYLLVYDTTCSLV